MNQKHDPWYRMPFVWLVLALPAVTVPAGLTTLALAMRGADEVVRDDFRVDGLAINHDPVRDAAARSLDVHATVQIARTGTTVSLHEGQAAVPDRLILILSHATLATEDRELRLARTGSRTFASDHSRLPRGHWYLELAPPDRAWRLTGEMSGADARVELGPRTAP